MMKRRAFLGLLGALAASRPLFGVQEPTTDGVLRLFPPTGQKLLDGSVRQGVFMDTGTGKPESGMFGNVRKYADGSPRFHEGIDIAPIQPWRRNRAPRDVVHAAADGLVVYVNCCVHNPSLYGNYAVITHQVKGFGEVYTLYAHLNRFADDLRAGLQVRAGHVLGVMGHTPDFPLARAHLHFEIGVMMNRYYPLIDEQHGVWNGANLYGIDPCAAFAEQKRRGFFDIGAYVRGLPEAFSVTVAGDSRPDYFCRYSLPCPDDDASRLNVVTFSAEGIPIRMDAVRTAVSSENVPGQVCHICPEQAVRGRGYVRNGSLTSYGETLLENLLVSPANLPDESARPPRQVGKEV